MNKINRFSLKTLCFASVSTPPSCHVQCSPHPSPIWWKSWAQPETIWQSHAQVAMVTAMGKKSHSVYVENDVYIVKRRPLPRTHSIIVTFDLLQLYCCPRVSLHIVPLDSTWYSHIQYAYMWSALHRLCTDPNTCQSVSYRYLLQITAPLD